MDMTFYTLILQLSSDQKVKILETKSLRRIQKELLAVRKFLGFTNVELTIKDETKLWKDRLKAQKRQQRGQIEASNTESQGELELSAAVFHSDSGYKAD